jgi:hypothetical protein
LAFWLVLLLIEQPSFKVGALLAVSIWCFCRFYYFAFYVISTAPIPAIVFRALVVRGLSPLAEVSVASRRSYLLPA